MDPETPPPDARCTCACPCCSSPWRRSVKRKLDLAGDADVARVEAGSEVAALREALAVQQQWVQDLTAELEEERSAAASAASETMSMILRIQREKAEVQMEARQFKRFAEERMAHDQQELAELDELLFHREEVLQSLASQLESYKHRLLSYGIDDDAPQFDLQHDYPPLRCSDLDLDLDDSDPEKNGDFRAIPGEMEDLQTLDDRIRQLETTQSTLVIEKDVVVQSTTRSSSAHSCAGNGSGFDPKEFDMGDKFPVTVDRASDSGGSEDDTSDRVYMIDAVHGVAVEVCEEYTRSPRDPGDGKVGAKGEVEGADIVKLYTRLQALEADRESMKQSIIAMRTEKAQLVLLREIAQQLCKEVKPEKRIVKKPSTSSSFSMTSIIKWIVSLFSWRRKASPSKYTFGLSRNNAGLLVVLDKSARMGELRCLTRPRG